MTIEYHKRNQEPETMPAFGVPVELALRYGRGLGIPIELVDKGHWNERAGLEKIRQSIYIALLTPIGRRMLQPDFGSLLPIMIFSPWDTRVQREMINQVKECLKIWVPQIVVETVTAELEFTPLNHMPHKRTTDRNIVLINIVYMVRGLVGFDEVKIPLSGDDNPHLKPNFFTIDGIPMFPKSGV